MMITFQDIIFKLQQFWHNQGCIVLFPYDTEKGAGTMSPHTFLKVLGKTPWNTAYVEPSRRPTDGRFAENPNRLQHYFQFQVIMKPSPKNIQDIYISSLKEIGIQAQDHDIRFVEDNWESPNLGAWGVGWEVWLDGMEVTQFTYFQQCGGIDLSPISVEITYGLERLAMFIQEKNSVYDIVWQDFSGKRTTYGDIYTNSEIENCQYNFEDADTTRLLKLFQEYEKESQQLIGKHRVFTAYDYCLKCSHTFNLLDAKGAIAVNERMQYILRIRKLAKGCASSYMESYEKA